MQFLSLNAVYSFCQNENIGLSRRYLTQLVRSGAIPHLKSGRKYLVDIDQLLCYLASPTISTIPTELGGIREVK